MSCFSLCREKLTGYIDVVNGERNILTLTIETGSDKNVTLVGVAGSFHNAESGALIKNVCINIHLDYPQNVC